MAILKGTRRASMIALGISLLALVVFAWGHASPDVAQAVGDGPAMSLAVPGAISCDADKCSVDGSQTFVLHVVAESLPAGGTAGFASEVLLPSGLEWKERANCGDEVQVIREDGGSLATCIVVVTTLLSGIGHNVLSEIALPPLAALGITDGGTLVEIDVNCLSMGSHQVTLAAVPDSSFGAVYSDLDATPARVKTEEGTYDADGDTTPETHQVGDTLTINCVEPPPATEAPPTATGGLPTPETTAEPTVGGTVGGPVTGVAGSGGDAGANAGLWVLIGSLLAASVAGTTIFGWRYLRT